MTTKERETKAAKQFDAKRQLRSGASPFSGEKEDLVSNAFLFQHKEIKATTETHTIKKMDLKELKQNAHEINKNPAYIMDFDGDIWVAVPKVLFDVIRDEIE